MGFKELVESADAKVRRILGGDELVTYTSGADESVDVYGIFEASSVIVPVGDPGISDVGPTVFLRLDELTSDPSTDESASVTYDGSDYRIYEARPDGLGGVLCLLRVLS